MENEKRRIAVLGSTGSIGTQTLDIIREYPEKYRVSLLTARRNWEFLARQALEFRPERVVIAEEQFLAPLLEALSGTGIRVSGGAKAIAEEAGEPGDEMVVTAMVGYSGLLPTIEAIRQGKTIALANKETLVVAGGLITRLLKEHDTRIIPVDSEHSAIFQCLEGEGTLKARKIILTASGGPFRTIDKEALRNVTAAEALKHPNWSMGAKVTIDSASMMNKGFEMMEAHWLFGCPPRQIEIVVHPQSIVHSMVEFQDGAIKAQLGIPDMHMPIRYALGYPERLETQRATLRLDQYRELTFEAPDLEKFPLLGFAWEALEKGGTMACILNAANEVAVQAFLDGRIRFTDMPEVARHAMDHTHFTPSPTLEDFINTHAEATRIASNHIGNI